MHSAKTTQEVWWPKKACQGNLALTISAKYFTNMGWMQHAWITFHCIRTKTVTSSVLAVQFVGQAEQLTSLLSPSLFEMQQQTALLFMLGPSPLRPFEVYCMSCSACMEAAAELSDQGQARAQQTTKRVLRSMIMNTAAYPEGRASAGRPQGLNAQPPCFICKLSCICLCMQWHAVSKIYDMHERVPRPVQVQQSSSCSCSHQNRQRPRLDSCQSDHFN